MDDTDKPMTTIDGEWEDITEACMAQPLQNSFSVPGHWPGTSNLKVLRRKPSQVIPGDVVCNRLERFVVLDLVDDGFKVSSFEGRISHLNFLSVHAHYRNGVRLK